MVNKWGTNLEEQKVNEVVAKMSQSRELAMHLTHTSHAKKTFGGGSGSSILAGPDVIRRPGNRRSNNDQECADCFGCSSG